MRIAFSLAVLASTVGAAPPQAVPSEPAAGTRFEAQQNRICRDRIEAVREERGLPALRRDTASPDEPLFIAAVDKRIDGCAVMVMRNDTSDLRPLPTRPAGPPRIQRIPGQ